jgi:hypothetical protein
MEEAWHVDREDAPEPQGSECTHVYLADGDVHICRGAACPYVELNKDKCYVCGISGAVVGALNLREDHCTGRQGGSANPDDHAGEPMGGTWKPKKDMMALSHQAYEASKSITEEDEGKLYVSPGRASPRAAAKRGARCVDEPPEPEEAAAKRPKPARRTGESREAFAALSAEAEMTMAKLVNFDRRPDGKGCKEKPPRDPRMMDKDVLFAAAIRKYTKECLATATAPTMDAVHNIALAAAKVAEEERRKAEVEEGRSALLLKVRMREQVTALAVQLWNASTKTPYMADARRGADSFRPFVCGTLYALKRGVELPDGTGVVPACPELAAALPALRATATNSVAKALHASSHRGLCTLHRSISSCSREQAAELYANAARLCAQLRVSVRNRQFDL